MIGESVEPYTETFAMVVDVPEVYELDEDIDWCRDDINAVEIAIELPLEDLSNNPICSVDDLE